MIRSARFFIKLLRSSACQSACAMLAEKIVRVRRSCLEKPMPGTLMPFTVALNAASKSGRVVSYSLG